MTDQEQQRADHLALVAARVCSICGKSEDVHPIWLTRGSWTHDPEWEPFTTGLQRAAEERVVKP